MNIFHNAIEGELFKGDDYSLHVLINDKGDTVETHIHDDWDESWVILKGKYLVIMNGTSFVVSYGDLVTVHRNITHSIESLEDGS